VVGESDRNRKAVDRARTCRCNWYCFILDHKVCVVYC
jgi:hypothetical protein